MTPDKDPERPRIAVYGAGALGAYFGGKLAQAGVDVHLIARGAQLDALRAGPLRVRSTQGDFETSIAATSETKSVGPCDAVILCVKAYHVNEIAPTLAPLMGEDTAVVPVQNGVAHLEPLCDAVGAEHVLGGAAFVFATVTEPGLVVHSAGPGSIVFGELDGRLSERAQRLDATLSNAGIETELVENIRERMWAKFAYICAHAGMTAAGRSPIGAIRASQPAWEMFRQLLDEIIELAQAEGVELAAGVADRLIEFANSLAPDSTSSMYNDLVSGRQTELEALHGFAVERAHRHGLSLPANEAVYALLAAQTTAPG
ncbi:MAG: ketopantoate reductase family protein [Gaiellaceae bacterium]